MIQFGGNMMIRDGDYEHITDFLKAYTGRLYKDKISTETGEFLQ